MDAVWCDDAKADLAAANERCSLSDIALLAGFSCSGCTIAHCALSPDMPRLTDLAAGYVANLADPMLPAAYQGPGGVA